MLFLALATSNSSEVGTLFDWFVAGLMMMGVPYAIGIAFLLVAYRLGLSWRTSA
jgi:hypothetical protein